MASNNIILDTAREDNVETLNKFIRLFELMEAGDREYRNVMRNTTARLPPQKPKPEEWTLTPRRGVLRHSDKRRVTHWLRYLARSHLSVAQSQFPFDSGISIEWRVNTCPLALVSFMVSFFFFIY